MKTTQETETVKLDGYRLILYALSGGRVTRTLGIGGQVGISYVVAGCASAGRDL